VPADADADAGNITIDKVVVNGGKPVVAGTTKAQRSKHGASTHPLARARPSRKCTDLYPSSTGRA
jgi:hypothetical protein